MTILVTGAAGFIGMHTCATLLDAGHEVYGIDNLNAYYDPQLKAARLDTLAGRQGFSFQKVDIADRSAVENLFSELRPEYVIHLAAQAGVRYSIENPHAYGESNLIGFLNILEGARRHRIKHLVYASSSSVYGGNKRMPFSENDAVDHPVSLYAATKKANELMAHSYSHLYSIPTTGLRFFTVYGPWGRPDMAYYLFTKAILAGQPINVFNHGKMKRDFTYVDDVTQGIVRVMAKPPTANPAFDASNPQSSSSSAPYRIANIGNHEPVELLAFIRELEEALGRTAKLNLMPMQDGDVESTFADTEWLRSQTGFAPATPLREGIKRFTQWYLQYH